MDRREVHDRRLRHRRGDAAGVAAGSVDPCRGGRIDANSYVVEAAMTLALIDVRNMTGGTADGPTVPIAASSPNSGWTARPISVSSGG